MTPLGIIFGVAYLVGLIRFGRAGLVAVMAVAAGFNDSAFLNIGGISLTSFYAGSMLYALITAFQFLHRPRPSAKRGIAPLLLLAYAVLITLISPNIFAGIPVFASDQGLDTQARAGLSELGYSSSNLAQVVYLLLNVVLLYTIGTGIPKIRTMIDVGIGIGGGVALSVSALQLNGKTWATEFFRNSERNFYSLWDVRAAGQFSEPSHLALFSTIAIGWWLGAALEGGSRSRIAWIMLPIAISSFALSASGTGYAGALGILGGVILIALRPAIAGDAKNAASRRIAGIFVLALPALVLLPDLVSWASDYVTSKSLSGSAATRSQADANAVEVLWQTFGLGSGLGSNRASSLLLMLLGMIGIIGTALYLVIVFVALRQGFRDPQLVSAFLGLTGGLSALFVSGADLANPLIWMLLAWCWSHLGPSQPDHTLTSSRRDLAHG